jgi:hypothetical protein
MPTAIDFGSRAEANDYRDEHPEHVAPGDDRRFTTVEFADDAPAWLLDQARLDAESGRAERESGPGQVALDDHEREEIDFRSTSVSEARAVKAIVLDEGVDDWLSYFDHNLTVDEHRVACAREREPITRVCSSLELNQRSLSAERIGTRGGVATILSAWEPATAWWIERASLVGGRLRRPLSERRPERGYVAERAPNEARAVSPRLIQYARFR